jgi:hypothetical protein
MAFLSRSVRAIGGVFSFQFRCTNYQLKIETFSKKANFKQFLDFFTQ